MRTHRLVVLLLLAYTSTTLADITLPYICDYLDVMFVVDGSASVEKANFNQVKSWLATTVENIYHSLGSQVQIGVLKYSGIATEPTHDLEVAFRIGDCPTKKCMTDNINDMRYMGGSTYTYAALNQTLKVQFPYSSRADVSRKLIVLITDGRAHDKDELPRWFQEARRMGVVLFALGVGNYNMEDFHRFAKNGTSDVKVYTVKGFNSLPAILIEMARKFCVDNDECENDTHNCTGNSRCRNLPGSYSCDCVEGFRKSEEGACEDIDECLQPTVCKGKTLCDNFDGGFACSCEEGYLEEEETCSECSCAPKDGYQGPYASCSNGKYNCSYRQMDNSANRTCSVPAASAFAALFSAIRDWWRRAEEMKNRTQVIRKVKEIDDAIKCAAAATIGTSSVDQKTATIEAISLGIEAELSGVPSETPLRNFSGSKLHTVLAHGMKQARLVGVEFGAPKKCMDLIIKQPEKSTEKSTLKRHRIYTGQTPVVSVTLFGGENFEKRSDTRVTFDINVTKDFSERSFASLIEPDPDVWSDHVSRVEYRCAYINTTNLEMMENGCNTTTYVRGSKAVCECDHTTMFTVLLTVTKVQIPTSVKIVGYVMEILTTLFLLLTAITLISVRRKIRGDRIGIQICLTTSLLFLHLFSLLGDVALKNETTCELLAVVVHYLLLASGMWMLMEGLTLVMKTNDYTLKYLSDERQKRFSICRHVVSWGLPFVIVIIAAAVGFTSGTYLQESELYMEQRARGVQWGLNPAPKYNICWLGPNILLWSVVLPMGAIISINCVVLVRMAFYIYKMSSSEDQFKPVNSGERRKSIDNTKATFKAILVLIPALGISWILAFLTNVETRDSSTVFLYVNAVFNGLQGLFLFIIYCVVGKEVRKAMKVKYERAKSRHESSGRLNSSRNGIKMSKKSKRSGEGKDAQNNLKTKSTDLPGSAKVSL